MITQRTYGPIAKFFHWTTAALLTAQCLVGWLMPDIKRGMSPGAAMSLHLSIGATLLALVVARYLWRLAKPVPLDANGPAWQRRAAEAVHASLYALLLAAMVTGWAYASMRGWSVALLGVVPLPALVAEGSELGRAVGHLHGPLVWVFLAALAIHVLAALIHAFIFRDGVLRRMLPATGRFRDGRSEEPSLA
jgi:cytochrome b561